MLVNVKVAGINEAIERMAGLQGSIHAALLKKTHVLALKLEAKNKNEKLNGGVLNRRTGALSRSIASDVIDEGSRIIGEVFSSGDVKYAAFWEFGFSGTENVKAHVRQITMAFGKPIPATAVNVKAHTRQVDQAARSFLRSSLKEMKDEIVSGLTAAVNEGIEK